MKKPGGSPGLTHRARGAAAWNYSGVVQEFWEYRRYETGASVAWTPLRFPGQYFDAETDTVENWNRLYDPNYGRYLQPEPMNSRNPENASPAYAYANSQPIQSSDPSGKFVILEWCENWQPALDEARRAAQCTGVSGNRSCDCQSALQGCDACDPCAFLSNGIPPEVSFIPDLKNRQNEKLDGATRKDKSTGEVKGVEFEKALCRGEGNVHKLAKAILEEAIHNCSTLTRVDIRDVSPDKPWCTGGALTDKCLGK